jgi:uracil-DNA glycosylase family protein
MTDVVPRSLDGLRKVENACKRCPLYRNATQAVPGEGPASARVMMAGEQPGNDADLKGHPFVGPAGRMLDRAIADAGIGPQHNPPHQCRQAFQLRATRQASAAQKRPNAYEIERCRWWLDVERKLVKPELIVALGATAARSLTGRNITMAKVRGDVTTLEDGSRLMAAVHPSSLLRIDNSEDRARQYAKFVDDLRIAQSF